MLDWLMIAVRRKIVLLVLKLSMALGSNDSIIRQIQTRKQNLSVIDGGQLKVTKPTIQCAITISTACAQRNLRATAIESIWMLALTRSNQLPKKPRLLMPHI